MFVKRYATQEVRLRAWLRTQGPRSHAPRPRINPSIMLISRYDYSFCYTTLEIHHSLLMLLAVTTPLECGEQYHKLISRYWYVPLYPCFLLPHPSTFSVSKFVHSHHTTHLSYSSAVQTNKMSFEVYTLVGPAEELTSIPSGAFGLVSPNHELYHSLSLFANPAPQGTSTIPPSHLSLILLLVLLVYPFLHPPHLLLWSTAFPL